MENFQNQHFDPNLIRGKANYLFCWKTLCWDMLSYTGHPFEITETGKLYEFTSRYETENGKMPKIIMLKHKSYIFSTSHHNMTSSEIYSLNPSFILHDRNVKKC